MNIPMGMEWEWNGNSNGLGMGMEDSNGCLVSRNGMKNGNGNGMGIFLNSVPKSLKEFDPTGTPVN